MMHKEIDFGEVVLLGQAYQLNENNNNINNIIDSTSRKKVHIQESLVASPMKKLQDDSTYVYCEVNDGSSSSKSYTQCPDQETAQTESADYDVIPANNNVQRDNLETAANVSKRAFDDIVSFFTNISNSNDIMNQPDYPQQFIDDLETRLFFTYRYGFPLIEKNKNGPNPLSLGSLFRGALDLSTIHKGFTTDSGWGCMIRTSQSLVANALLNNRLGRKWRLCNATVHELEKHWETVAQFADTPEAVFSIHNFVSYANKYCGTKAGEWFGPSNAARSIQTICEDHRDETGLRVYMTNDSGDIFEDSLMNLASTKDSKFTPILILCGIRLGVKTVNEIYWDFLKYILFLPYSVGIAGGRPSSSHYFLGFQSDYLLYMDPHTAQTAILIDSDGKISDEEKRRVFSTIHNTRLQRIHLSKIDPSMLVGFLIRSEKEYDDFKEKITRYKSENKFINIYQKEPDLYKINSAGSDLEGFVDLGVESINEDDEAFLIDNTSIEDKYCKFDGSDLVEIAGSSQELPSNFADIIDIEDPSLIEEPIEFIKDETIEKESLIIVSPEDKL